MGQQQPMFGGVRPATPTQPYEGIAPSPLDQPPKSQRQRLAEAILNATGGGEPQPVQHPLQAIGNASQQMAAAYLKRQQQQQQQQQRWGFNPNRQARGLASQRPLPRKIPPSY